MKVYVVVSGYADYEGGGETIHSVFSDYDKAVSAARALPNPSGLNLQEVNPWADDEGWVFYMGMVDEKGFDLCSDWKGVKEFEVQ
jgi:hypothetical protein